MQGNDVIMIELGLKTDQETPFSRAHKQERRHGSQRDFRTNIAEENRRWSVRNHEWNKINLKKKY